MVTTHATPRKSPSRIGGRSLNPSPEGLIQLGGHLLRPHGSGCVVEQKRTDSIIRARVLERLRGPRRPSHRHRRQPQRGLLALPLVRPDERERGHGRSPGTAGVGLDGAASVNSAGNQVSVIFGGVSGAAAVTVNGLGSAFADTATWCWNRPSPRAARPFTCRAARRARFRLTRPGLGGDETGHDQVT